ncbi:hypothetical protein VNO80_25606 [Phaseolus coccineus]|uniref:Uncharacterized protein n=1 Tax=Phaseolus coccineus TaxID=3886 RepID=A0AAN9QM25_PHACN
MWNKPCIRWYLGGIIFLVCTGMMFSFRVPQYADQVLLTFAEDWELDWKKQVSIFVTCDHVGAGQRSRCWTGFFFEDFLFIGKGVLVLRVNDSGFPIEPKTKLKEGNPIGNSEQRQKQNTEHRIEPNRKLKEGNPIANFEHTIKQNTERRIEAKRKLKEGNPIGNSEQRKKHNTEHRRKYK